MACPPGYYCWQGTETADWNSEGTYKPIACPKSVYCLGGITNNLTNENDYRAPQPCPLGQYCKEASTSPFGTGLYATPPDHQFDCVHEKTRATLERFVVGRCPKGFYCPKGTAHPFASPAGYFSRGEGNSQAVPCLAGTWSKYNPHNGTDSCFLCPGGYSCASEGTIEPLACTPGTFRYVRHRMREALREHSEIASPLVMHAQSLHLRPFAAGRTTVLFLASYAPRGLGIHTMPIRWRHYAWRAREEGCAG